MTNLTSRTKQFMGAKTNSNLLKVSNKLDSDYLKVHALEKELDQEFEELWIMLDESVELHSPEAVSRLKNIFDETHFLKLAYERKYYGALTKLPRIIEKMDKEFPNIFG